MSLEPIGLKQMFHHDVEIPGQEEVEASELDEDMSCQLVIEITKLIATVSEGHRCCNAYHGLK
jgi:hypothetical protein